MRRVFMLLFLVLLVQNCFSVIAAEKNKSNIKGWRESYGGDLVVSEFQSIAYNLGKNINKAKSGYLLSEVEFLNLIQNTRIDCRENLYLDGVKKDAINYPLGLTPRIELDCLKFSVEKNEISKKRLVLHEYLHLAFIDDSSYQFSNSILNELLPIITPSHSEFQNVVNKISQGCKTNAVEVYLNKGSDPNFRNEVGRTLLWFAVINGCESVVEIMIKNKANIHTLEDDFKLNALVFLVLSEMNKIDYLDARFEKTSLSSRKVIKMLLEKNPSFKNLVIEDINAYLGLISFNQEKNIENIPLLKLIRSNGILKNGIENFDLESEHFKKYFSFLGGLGFEDS